MRLGTSTKAKVAAAILTAAIPMVGSFAASAQQMAAASTGSGPNFATCDAIKDAAKSAQCYHDTKISFFKGQVAAADARGAVADARGAVADKEGACADQLVSLRATDATVVNRGRLILAGRPLKEFGACNLVAALTRG